MKDIVRKGYGAIKKQALVVMLIVIMLLFGALSEEFLKLQNLLSILRQISIYGIMSCGIVFVLVGGNIDLTAGMLLSLTCCVMVRLHTDIGPAAAIVVTILVGMASGFITGFLVGYVRLNGLITTLGIQSIILSATQLYTRGKYFTIPSSLNAWFPQIGQGSLLGIPVQTYIYVLMLIIFNFILVKTKFGYQIKAVGGNQMASRYSGIDNRKRILQTFVISGFCVGVAGVVLAARGLAARVAIGDGFDIDVLASCVLGGTSLLGGVGSVKKTFFGILILGVLRNGYVMMGLPYYVQWLTQCVIILTVVTIDIISKKKVIA